MYYIFSYPTLQLQFVYGSCAIIIYLPKWHLLLVSINLLWLQRSLCDHWFDQFDHFSSYKPINIDSAFPTRTRTATGTGTLWMQPAWIDTSVESLCLWRSLSLFPPLVYYILLFRSTSCCCCCCCGALRHLIIYNHNLARHLSTTPKRAKKKRPAKIKRRIKNTSLSAKEICFNFVSLAFFWLLGGGVAGVGLISNAC